MLSEIPSIFMCVFSLILFMVITAAFEFFNGVAIKPLVYLLHSTNRTDQLKNEKRERMNSVPL